MRIEDTVNIDLLRNYGWGEDGKNQHAKAIEIELKKAIIPTQEPVVRAIVSRVDYRDLLRNHVYAKENRLRLGFSALISASFTAHLDLRKSEAALSAFAQINDMDEHIDHTVTNPAQKEVMAFCAAYYGTIDTLRRLKVIRADLSDKIDEIRKNNTDHIEHKFILDLRKNLSHGSVTIPYWSTKTDKDGVTGTIMFSKKELLTYGEWKSDVRNFLKNIPDNSFSITSIISGCAKDLSKFQNEMGILFARHRSNSEQDFFAIMDLARRSQSNQINKMIIQQLIKLNIDPYAHLQNYFSEEQTRRILEYKRNSIDQINYIIKIKETEMDIDDNLKNLILEFFKVPERIEIQKESISVYPRPLGNKWPPPGLKPE